VSLELTNPDRANQTQTQDGKKKASKGGDELVEIRLYVPGTHTKGGGDDEEGEEEEEEEDEETSAAQAFHDMIKDKADIGQVQGECIVVFNEVLVSTPRYVMKTEL
jgi:structure-specific recognition protein 1